MYATGDPGPDPEGRLRGGGRPSMASDCGPRDPGAEPLWGSRGITPGRILSIDIGGSCYPCSKSTEFVRKIKVKVKFGGIFGGGAAAPCAPPPGSGTV